MWTLHKGDCLEIMPTLPDKSIDMILCDLPYGTTACKWDVIIPFESLWAQYERLIKDNGAIVLTASQPFTSMLVMSNPKLYKYDWIWKKNNVTGFPNAKNRPLKSHETISVFSFGIARPCMPSEKYKEMRYYPQGLMKTNKYVKFSNKTRAGLSYRPSNDGRLEYTQEWTNYPKDILEFSKESQSLHPTQKPVKLFEYLIRTYTNVGDTVLDNCAGSGTTGAACENTGRDSILIEKEPKYCEIIRKRLSEPQNVRLFDDY